jgi:hypothetical protein
MAQRHHLLSLQQMREYKFWCVEGCANPGSKVKYDIHLNVCIKSLPAHDTSEKCSVRRATVQFAVKNDRQTLQHPPVLLMQTTQH